jgi:phytoene dehydrogenase-like protein
VAQILIVGAGMSGMAAAARLAARRHEVTVCDASATFGGALSTWRHGDLSFDTGPYTLTLPAVYRDLFVKTGSRKASAAAKLEDRVDLQPLDPVRRYVFPDGTRLDLPNASRGRLRAAFDEAFGGGAGDGWLRLIDHGGRAWEVLRPALVEAPGSGGRDLLRLLARGDGRRALTPGRSLRRLSRGWFSDPRLRLLMDDYLRQAGADPRRAPGVSAARVYIEHTFGAWRISGGLYRLAEELHQRAADRGAEFRFQSPVQRIETEPSSAVTGVVLADGERLSADVVIAAVDRGELARLLGRASSASASAGTQPGTRSRTTLCLEVSAPADGSTPPQDLPHETVFLRGDGTSIRVHVPVDQPTAWTVHATGVSGVKGVSRLGDSSAILAALAESGLDIRGRARVLHEIPADAAARVPADAGLRAVLLRSPVSQPIRGLFHVGTSARPGTGLSFAALSAWHAAELIGPAAR